MGDPLGITASLIAVLQATSVAVNYFQGVRNAAKDIKDFIDELELLKIILTSLCDYATANPDSTTLQTFDTPLRKCISDITELHAKLVKGFSRRGMSLRWPLMDKECSEYLSKIERLKSGISLAMSAEQDNRSRKILKEVSAGREQDSALQQNKKRMEVLNWLNPTAYNERHHEISNRRQNNTGDWLLKKEVVVDWIGGNSAFQLLWGYGIPGAGKTFLSSRMVDHLRDLAIAANWGVAFMYFNHSEQNQQTPIFFLSSLVKQFACQIVHLPEQLNDLYEQLYNGQKNPTFEQLYCLLLAVTKLFTQAFIICDALDECEQNNQRTKLLPLFDRMGKDGMRLFLTSREYPEDIQRALQSSGKIRLSAQDEDIRVYIERKIAENPRAESLVKQAKCKEKIISELQTCANGMFLLVHFHIRYLCEQTNPRQLLAALDTLSESSSVKGPMDPTYNRAMKTIKSQPDSCIELALKILTWLVKSQRVLTVCELQQVVSVEQHHTTFDELTLSSEKTMIDVCASLVTIDQESNTVRLIHYTVKEYLINNAIIPENADFMLFMACATFLSYECFSNTSTSMEAQYEMYPFIDYAGMHFIFHLQQCDEALSLDLVHKFLKSTQNVLFYVQVAGNSSYFQHFLNVVYPSADPSIILAAYFGHTFVMRSLLEECGGCSDCDMKSIQPALCVAVERGFNSMIELLLENGAEIDNDMLCSATLYGHVLTIRLLIAKGAGVSTTNYGGDTPLHIAALLGNDEIVRILLEKGADVSATGVWGQTPLHNAVSDGNQEAIKILLTKGANISATDYNRQTPLHIAASYGNQEAVKILLEKGADVSATDYDRQTPLHIAASYGNQEAVKILLEKGADVSATDNEGLTPMLEGLLHGIDVN